MSSQPAIVANRFELEHLLGEGRLSRVWLARDREHGHAVALKILQPHLRAQPSVVRRFRREMAAVQRLEHPQIVRIYDLVETDEHLALVMAYAPGASLKSRVRDHGALAPEAVVDLGARLLDALEHAHLRGVLHRDLSLENVLATFDATFDEGGARVEGLSIIGFGLARVDELVGLTMHTRILGALETMAPERILGKDADARADLYAIGAMLFELATGRPLHDGLMSTSLRFATKGDYLDEVREALAEVPAALRDAICRALAPDPALRFASAGQMRDALEGRYDLELWQAWEAREGMQCPGCERPAVEGLATCVHCGHAFARLIQKPGQGTFAIEILSPRAVFKADDWFEVNLEGTTLTDAQVGALREVMHAHDDTRAVFVPAWDDAVAPYELINGLTEDEAERISILFDRRGIPHGVRRMSGAKRGGWALHAARRLDPAANERQASEYLFMLVVVTLAIGGILAYFNREIFETDITLAWMVAAVAMSTGILVNDRVAERVYRELDRLGLRDPARPPARVESAALRGRLTLEVDGVLPPRAAEILRELGRRADAEGAGLEREFNDVLALTLRLYRDGRVPAAALNRTMAPMFDHAAGLLERLAEVERHMSERNTAQLFARLEALDARIEVCDETAQLDALFAERTALLEELDALDVAVYERSLLRGHLLALRAALLDLQAQFGGQEVPSLQAVEAQISELRHRFEAQREVLDLVRQA